MKFRSRIILTTLFLLSGLSLNSYAYHGLPYGAKVVSGSATITRLNHHTEIITTTTNQAIINFKGFSISSKNLVDVIEPNAGSSLLIRVTGINPSKIYGTLDVSTGSLFLVNPNGIIFGPNSTVNAPALLVSTLDITNSDFLNGNYNFFEKTNNGNSYIINQGRLAASPGGYIALLSQAVNNKGTIIADQGSIAIGSGNKMTVALDSQDQISVVINDAVKNVVLGPDGQPINSAIANSGTLQANGGKVLLTASVLNNVFDNAVNNSGIIQADSLQNNNGDIQITASGAPVVNSGSIEGGQISINSQEDITSTGTLSTDGYKGILNLTSEGDIYSLGVLDADGLIVSGNSFKVGGSLEIGGAELMNTNSNAIEFIANTSLTGNFADESFNGGNIVIDPGVTLTLTGDTSFLTEKGFLMDTTSSINGGGYNLSISAIDDSTVGTLNNINNLTLISMPNLNTTFTEAIPINNIGSITLNNATFCFIDSNNYGFVGGLTSSGTGGIIDNNDSDTISGTIEGNIIGGIVPPTSGTITLDNTGGSIVGTLNTGSVTLTTGTITINNNSPITGTITGNLVGSVPTGSVTLNTATVTEGSGVSINSVTTTTHSNVLPTDLLNTQISSTIFQSSNLSNLKQKFASIFNPSLHPVADIDLSAFNSSAK